MDGVSVTYWRMLMLLLVVTDRCKRPAAVNELLMRRVGGGLTTAEYESSS